MVQDLSRLTPPNESTMFAGDRRAILKKISAIQKEVTRIEKGGTNVAQGYKYLSETQIAEVFKPLLETHGVVFLASSRITGKQPNSSGKQILTDVEIVYEFVDVESGQSVAGIWAGQGADPNDKGVYKGVTGAIKYIFMKTFLIPTGDDPEDDSKEKRSKKSHLDEDKPPFGEGAVED